MPVKPDRKRESGLAENLAFYLEGAGCALNLKDSGLLDIPTGSLVHLPRVLLSVSLYLWQKYWSLKMTG